MLVCVTLRVDEPGHTGIPVSLSPVRLVCPSAAWEGGGEFHFEGAVCLKAAGGFLSGRRFVLFTPTSVTEGRASTPGFTSRLQHLPHLTGARRELSGWEPCRFYSGC